MHSKATLSRATKSTHWETVDIEQVLAIVIRRNLINHYRISSMAGRAAESSSQERTQKDTTQYREKVADVHGHDSKHTTKSISNLVSVG